MEAEDVYGCTYSSGSVVLSDPDPISFLLTASSPSLSGSCDGSIIVSSIMGGSGIGTYTFDWIGPTGYSSNVADIFSLCPGIYELTITDSNNCTGTSSAVIIDPSCNINVYPLLTQPDCNGDLGQLMWSITGGVSPYLVTVYDSTTNIIISVVIAPLARIFENAAWPGVSINVIFLSSLPIW